MSKKSIILLCSLLFVCFWSYGQQVSESDTMPVQGNSLSAKKALKEKQHMEKQMARKERLATIPFSTFFTLNAEYMTMPQWSYGFKIGTMKLVGWYFSAMTNFHYKGAFTSFSDEKTYTLTGKSRGSASEALLGLTFRYFKPVSFHIGAGFVYRTYCMESEEGWFYYPKSTFWGPEMSVGLMYHIKGIVLSTEFVGMYNFDKYNPNKFAIGGKLGVGFCIPTRKGKNVKP